MRNKQMKTTLIFIVIVIVLTATCLIVLKPFNLDSPTSGMQLEWTHFIGGNAWITRSPDGPISPNATQAKPGGGVDIFLLALNIADNTLAYGSYLGGSNDETSICLSCDRNGALYAIGSTNSEDFPIGSRTSDGTGISKEGDLFISKFLIK